MADDPEIVLEVVFFRSDQGIEPVRDWLKSLTLGWRKTIGKSIKTVQFGWPIGMPLVRKLENDLWEVRCRKNMGISRVLFTVLGKSMVLLHGFIKKSQKTPAHEIHTARQRLLRLQKEDAHEKE